MRDHAVYPVSSPGRYMAIIIIINNLLYGRRVRRLRHRRYHTRIIYEYAFYIGAYYPPVEVVRNNKCQCGWVEEEYHINAPYLTSILHTRLWVTYIVFFSIIIIVVVKDV